MKTVRGPIADPVSDPIEPLTLIFDLPIEEYGPPDSESAYTRKGRAIYRHQAVVILDAMEQTCPGGFTDALLCELLDRRASILRVPWSRSPKKGEPPSVPMPRLATENLSPLLQKLTSVVAHVADMERQIDELTQTTIEQRARIENYEAELRELRELRREVDLWRGTASDQPGEGPVREEVFGALAPASEAQGPVTVSATPPGLWLLPHRGDPCIYCKQSMEEVGVGGCPVTVQQLYSRIGELADEGVALEEKGQHVEARAKNEESLSLRRLHGVLAYDMRPAGEV